MNVQAWSVRPGDWLRIGPKHSAKVRSVGGSPVLKDGIVFWLQDGSIHTREDARVQVLRREGKDWTEAERQWTYDNDVASSRPGGSA